MVGRTRSHSEERWALLPETIVRCNGTCMRVRTRWASEEFEYLLTSAGMPSPKTAEITILELHATEPPL
jgi:hypothetical protein